MIVRQNHLSWPEPRRQRHCLLLEIDLFDIANEQRGPGQQTSQRADGIQNPNASGDDFGQHGLEHEVVFLADQNDFDIRAIFQLLLKINRSIDAAETTSQNDDPLLL